MDLDTMKKLITLAGFIIAATALAQTLVTFVTLEESTPFVLQFDNPNSTPYPARVYTNGVFWREYSLAELTVTTNVGFFTEAFTVPGMNKNCAFAVTLTNAANAAESDFSNQLQARFKPKKPRFYAQ
jgi:hypothetical protein